MPIGPTQPPMDPAAMNAGALAIMDRAQFADQDDEAAKAKEAEHNAVKKLWEEYDTARKFDKAARQQYAIDRRYAAGTADARWAVNTNLIGSHIDILTSFLYARNPDVSCKKSPKVDSRGTKQDEDFARTLELVISMLWKKARIKRTARKGVRSGLSTGTGWLKAIMVADDPQMPQTQDKQNDLRDNLALLQCLQDKLAGYTAEQYEEMSDEQRDATVQEVRELVTATMEPVEVSVRKYLAIDFCASQDVQVSLDVSEVGDYLDADWVANAIYRPCDKLPELFPRLKEDAYKDSVKEAVKYFQKPQKDLQPVTDQQAMAGMPGAGVAPEEAEQYVTATGNGTASEDGPAFAKIVELWDRRTNHIKTMIEGVKCWPVEPYQPPYPSSRFYPFFLIAFYEVDGARHPQSLSWRLAKLQDEYARSRSNFRLTRERSIPGIIFNSDGLADTEVQKIMRSVHQEYIGLKPTQPDQKLSDLFAEKPVAQVDMRLYDNAPIISDMEKVSGVQEALQTSTSVEKTATQADIEQQGFASRTTADRDTLESVLTDLANYTGEVSLSALTTKDVQRICGAAAFWPENMDIDDLLTMVEVTIEAGTTGKPRNGGDREAWGIVLPIIKETIAQVQQAIIAGNIPLANALTELLRETMVRMGDDTDIDRFIAQPPTTPTLDPVTGQPMVPGAPGAVPGAGADPAGLPPGDAAAGTAGPSLPEPQLASPELQPPV